MSLRAKDHLEDTKVAAFPSPCAPQKVQASSAAVWRSPTSGDQEGDGRSGYPRRSGRPNARESSEWVRVSTASKKARRTGAVLLHLYAASYGRWLLSKERPQPLWGYGTPAGPSFLLSPGAPATRENVAIVDYRLDLPLRAVGVTAPPRFLGKEDGFSRYETEFSGELSLKIGFFPNAFLGFDITVVLSCP